jgi:imidazolonepropionase-like amidohydrolase
MAQAQPLWLRSHHVWNERSGRFEAAAVLVENDTVTAVAKYGDVPAGARLIDLGEAWVMPGLLNTHVHLDFSASTTPLKDFYDEDPAERLLRAAGNAHQLLMSGCTTARDCGSQWTTLALARRPDLSPVPLPRLLLSGPPITVPKGHLHFMDGIVTNDVEIFAHIDRVQREGGRSVKVMISGGQMTPGSKPEDTMFEQPALDLITAESRRRSCRASPTSSPPKACAAARSRASTASSTAPSSSARPMASSTGSTRTTWPPSCATAALP